MPAVSRSDAGKPKRKKLVVRFDEENRKNYLTGFQKRKKLRRKNALRKQEQLIAEKKKQVRIEVGF
jgi:ribosomal RNA-processing protein 17